MGRVIPPDDHLSAYPIISASLLAAIGMAAAIAFVIALCGDKPPPEEESKKPSTENKAKEESEDPPPYAEPLAEKKEEAESDLPPPAGGLVHRTYSHNEAKKHKTGVKGKLSAAAHVSLKLPRSVSVSKLKDIKKDVKEDLKDLKHIKVKHKHKHEDKDTLWKKPLIMGEKNRNANNSYDADDQDSIYGPSSAPTSPTYSSSGSDSESEQENENEKK